MFPKPRCDVCLGHTLTLVLAYCYIQSSILYACCNIENVLWDKEVVGTCRHWDQGCWWVGASNLGYPQSWTSKLLFQNHHDIKCSSCHVLTHDWELENLMFWLWPKLSSDALISTKLSKFMKVVEIAHVQVLGNVEDEGTFNSLSFLKSKSRNWLPTQLDLVVRMFAKDFYTLNAFPYQVALSYWKTHRVWYGREE